MKTRQPASVRRRGSFQAYYEGTHHRDRFRGSGRSMLRKGDNEFTILISHASLVRITSATTSILRGKLQQAHFIYPTSASVASLRGVVTNVWRSISAEGPARALKSATHAAPVTNQRVCCCPAFSAVYSDTWTGNSA